MNNIALKSLSVKNFSSFAEPISFTTEIDKSKKEYLHNTFELSDNVFNRVSFIYGANGSGKSMFCKIMLELQRIINLSPAGFNNDALNSVPGVANNKGFNNCFAFDTKYKNAPTEFSLEIMIEKTNYSYSFTIYNNEITSETLTKKYRRKEALIQRTSPDYKDIVLRSELKGFEPTKQVVRRDALCLPVAAMLNNKLAIIIKSAIDSITVINMTAAKINPPKFDDSFSDERVAKYTAIIKKADPTIENICVSFEEREIGRQKISSDFENREIISKMTTIGIDTNHAVFCDGKQESSTTKSLFEIESLGTIKLFTVLPHLFDVLENGGIMFIDELENGLHLSLAQELIALFIDEKTNPNHAQLICTSHQPLLLDNKFRRDQVWVTAKDEFGKSSLHRLSELSTPRAETNLSEKNKLMKAFGCNPEKFFS
ncbi:MAG: ATP-binding protein [Eubacterium sp.]|nr:ATP-binding protein [Eubacterium sp.]